MKKAKSLMIATGIIAGLGVCALPLTSYAVADTVNVSVSVSDTIAMTISNKNISLGTIAPGNNNATGNSSTITVVSNNMSGYTVTAAGTSLTGGTGTTAIPYGDTAAATSAWGISKTTDSGYTGLTGIASTSTKSVAGGDTYTIYFGAHISSAQETGTYSGSVTFTAANNS